MKKVKVKPRLKEKPVVKRCNYCHRGFSSSYEAKQHVCRAEAHA